MERLGQSDHVTDLLRRELETFYARHRQSRQLHADAQWWLPQGVPSSVCALHPFPVAIDHGDGARLYDIDGNRFYDYHNGFGTSIFGHAHPLLVEAIDRQAARGTHFGAMTREAAEWAEVVCERFSLDWVRFSPSGTEATMDALRLARAATGRVKICKIEGGYHGSHLDALVSTNMPLDGSEGPDEAPYPRFFSQGISPRVLEEVVPLPFNDAAAAERVLSGGEIAAVIVEPILFNVGTIWPQDGYLQKLRELCDTYGTILIFDETKTGATIAYGGAEELFGVKPHLKTLGKGIGGGLACGAIGDCEGTMRDLVEEWKVPHLGTFSGNPLAAAAGTVALRDILVPEAYEKLQTHHELLSEKLSETIRRYQLPAYVTGVAAKGCIVWAEGAELRDFRDYKRRFDFRLGYLAWLYLINRGIFLAPGQDEQWTTSVFHDDEAAEGFAAAFAELAAELR